MGSPHRTRTLAAPCLALAAALSLGCGTATPSTPDAAIADAGTDAPLPPDAGVSFLSMTMVTTLSQDCMPIVADDPLAIAGSLVVTNTGAVPIGPIHVTDGLVLRLLGGDTIATFAVAPFDLPAIAPGATVMAPFTKTAGSLSGGAGLTGCDVVACGTPVRIALALSGADLPVGARAASEPLTVPCAF